MLELNKTVNVVLLTDRDYIYYYNYIFNGVYEFKRRLSYSY